MRQTRRRAVDSVGVDEMLPLAVELADQPLTVTELVGTFGPNWRAVVAVVRQTGMLTDQQLVDLAEAYVADALAWDLIRAGTTWNLGLPDDRLEMANRYAGNAVQHAARLRSERMLQDTPDPADYCRRLHADTVQEADDLFDAAANAAGDAVIAGSLADLVGVGSYTQLWHRAFLGPWQQVLGDPFAVEVWL